MAREFAPTLDVAGPNFTARSQGPMVDRSFETLFEGLGNAAAGAANVMDESIQNRIRGQAQESFNSLNEDFGFTPETIVAEPGQMPTEIRTFRENAQRLVNARNQGKLTDTAYYARMVSDTRRLKSSFPGYGEQVDQIIQDVTGTRPANALRSAMLSEVASIEAERGAQNDRNQRWVDQNEALIELFAPGYFNGEYDVEVARRRVRKEQAKLERINYESQIETATQAQQSRLFESHARQIVTSNLKAGTNRLGFDFESPGSVRTLFENPDFDPQAFGQMLEGQKLATRRSIEESMFDPETGELKPAYNSLSKKERDELIDSQLSIFDDIREAVGLGDYDALDFYKNQINLRESRTQLDFLTQNPDIQKYQAIVEALGPELSKAVLSQEQGLKASKQIADALAIELFGDESGSVSPASQIDKMNQSDSLSDEEKSAVAVDYINRMKTGLTKGGTPEQTAQLAKTIFGNGGMDIFENIQSDQRYQFFTTMATPRIAQNIANSGDQEAIKAYTDWMTNAFGSLTEFRTLASTNRTTGLIDKVTTVGFDGGKFVLEFDEAEVRSLGGSIEGGVKAWQKRLEQVNRAVATILPVLEAQGLSGEEATREAVRLLSEEAQGGMVEPGSLLGKMMLRIDQPDDVAEFSAKFEETQLEDFDFEAAKVALVEGGQSSYKDPAVRQILDMVGSAEGADYNDVFGYNQNKYGWTPTEMTISEVRDAQRQLASDTGSSAFGKYQIMGYTLDDAIEALGLSGDEKFTAELQDKIAVDYLLKRRGYNQWIRGEISNEQFLNNLAKEWASVPTTAGVSFYAGDSMNNKATGAGAKLASFVTQ